jgi:hypothetical protein
MSERKIVCKITGKSYVFAADYFNAKVNEYTDIESLRKYFITKKAKTLLLRGYSVNEIRNLLGIDTENLDAEESQQMQDLIVFHKKNSQPNTKKSTSSLNFTTHKSDSDVASFINNIRDYE